MGQLYVVSWDVTVTVVDQTRALVELRDMAKSLTAKPVMVVVLGEALTPPEADVRQKGLDMIRGALAIAQALEVVVNGRGVLGTLQRSTARGVSLLVPALRGRVHVQESLRAAVQHAAKLTAIDVPEALANLGAAGFSLDPVR